MNSKEALKYLSNESIRKYDIYSNNCWNNEIAAYDKFRDCLNTITKDLERLEKLEQQNQELREYFDKIASGNTIIELFRENHNFKKVMEFLSKYIVLSGYGRTKKAYINFYDDDVVFDLTDDIQLEKYKLLKEVLCDV